MWTGPEHDAAVDRTIIVGGGITAAQLACRLTETQSVALLSRGPLQWAAAEAPAPWVTWQHIEAVLHTTPPGSAARLETAQAARNDGTVPPYLYESIEQRTDAGDLVLAEGSVRDAAVEDGTVRLRATNGLELTGDRVILATGFGSVSSHPLLNVVADRIGLRRGAGDLPVLEDDTLRWCRESGGTAPVYRRSRRLPRGLTPGVKPTTPNLYYD